MSSQKDDKIWVTRSDDESLNWAEQAAAFLQGFLSGDASPVWSADLFRWKLGEQNPAGRGYLSVAFVDDEIVATTSITPKRMWVNGKVQIGGEIGDTYTDERYRRSGSPQSLFSENDDPSAYVNKSIFGRLVWETRRRAEKDGITLIYGTPNQNSMPGYVKRLDFFHYDAIHTHSFLRLRASGLIKRKPVLRPFHPVWRGFDFIFSKAGLNVSRLRTRGISVDATHPSDEEIDNLWNRVRDNLQFSLVKDARWFRFRYLQHPDASYSFLYLRQNDQLKGIMVFRLDRDMSGQNVLTVADVLLEAPAPEFFARLVAEGIDRFADDAETVHFWGEPDTLGTKMAGLLGFITRGDVPLILANTENAASLYKDRAPFDLSVGVSDNI